MTTARFQPSTIKNKVKREDVSRKNKKARTQAKLQKRLSQAKLEANDPAAKKVRLKLPRMSRGLNLVCRNASQKMYPKPLTILVNLTLLSLSTTTVKRAHHIWFRKRPQQTSPRILFPLTSPPMIPHNLQKFSLQHHQNLRKLHMASVMNLSACSPELSSSEGRRARGLRSAG